MATVKRIDPISVPAVENSLGIFDILPTSVAFNRTHIRELLPLMTITRDGPYTFRLFSDSQFVDFSKTWFFLKISIEKKNEDNNYEVIGETDDDKNVGVVQNFASSFIKQLKITINGIDVYNSGPLYPYKAYLDTEFNTQMNFKKGFHEAGLYFPDSGDQDSVTNDGFKKRSKMFAKGNIVNCMVLLNFDLAHQNNLFLNNSDIVFTITPHNDNFLFLNPNYKKKTTVGGVETELDTPNTTTYRLKVHEVKLYCTLVDVVQSLQNQLAKQLETTPAKYPLRKTELRQLFLPKGTTNIAWNVFTSVVPRRLMVFFIENEAFDGKTDKSPFKFTHAKVESLWVEANNIIVPNNPYQFSYNESTMKDYVRAFTDLYEGLDHINQEKAVELTMEKFINGWTGFVFPLSSSWRDAGDSFELIKNGTTVIKGRLSEPARDNGYMMIAVGEFDEVLSINADRILSVDGSI